ncbi:MAG: hypothetical protein RID42_10825 [Alphaproteobacteria bacterium]
MGIYSPEPRFSIREKKILQLLGKLLVETSAAGTKSNLPHDRLALSDDEADELSFLISQLLENREFLEKVQLTDELFAKDPNEKLAREIFLRGRKNFGHTRAMATIQWSDFQIRIGRFLNVSRGTSASVMPFDHFAEMERRLFHKLGLANPVVELLCNRIAAGQEVLESLQAEKTSSRRGQTQRFLKRLRQRSVSGIPMARANLEILAIVIADSTVYWTTRDWTATGTMSVAVATALQHRRR